MDRRGWIETSLAAVISLIMSITGPLLLFFMLPLQILAVRCGKIAFSYSASGVFFGSIILKKILLTPDVGGTGSLVFADSAIFFLLLSGLYAVNFLLEKYRTILRLLIITATAGLVSIPVIYYLNSDQVLNTAMIDQLDSILVMLNGGTPESSIFSSVSAEDLYSLFKIYFLNSFLAVYFFLLALTWWMGSRFGLRSIGKASRVPTIKEFKVPEKLVWFFFVPLTIVLLNVLLESKGAKMEMGLIGFAVSNSLYIMGTLYAIQGFSLVQFFLEKKTINPGIRRLSVIILIISLFIFPLNVLIVILLPGLGVSELWINYRIKDKEIIQ
ncbi:MAG: DUF2232 domain-containing protein [Spirochaetaceae bacterium]|nr:DUF2232 domain-containing protein [Spirochaetaceae bacterium]